jgi:hypothetical protein
MAETSGSISLEFIIIIDEVDKRVTYFQKRFITDGQRRARGVLFA